MYDLLIQTNLTMYAEEGMTPGGTERQILTVATELADRGVDVAILHSHAKGTDRIVQGVKHLNMYRHHYDYSKVRLFCNQFVYVGNMHYGYELANPQIAPLSPIEMNSAEQSYLWFHNWMHTRNEMPKIFNSKAIQRYVYNNVYVSSEKTTHDRVIPYMVPTGFKEIPSTKREKYLLWSSAFGKGFREALLTYIALYERGLNREFYVCCPPQRVKKDLEIFERCIKDLNVNNYPVRWLGELEYSKGMQMLKNAACLFRPTMPPETFGLVYLEANKLGVPVITMEGDAGEEILTDKNNFIIRRHHNLKDIQNWLEDIETKQTKVNLKQFDPDTICKKWISLLEKK